jgi:hypothetical protein
MPRIDRKYSTQPAPAENDIAAQTAAFLAAGGKIQQCPPCVTSDQIRPDSEGDDDE